MSTMQDMNNRIHQNRAQLSSKRPKFKENNRDLIYSEEEKSEGLIFKTVSQETLMELKTQIRARAKKERKTRANDIWHLCCFCIDSIVWNAVFVKFRGVVVLAGNSISINKK